MTTERQNAAWCTLGVGCRQSETISTHAQKFLLSLAAINSKSTAHFARDKRSTINCHWLWTQAASILNLKLCCDLHDLFVKLCSSISTLFYMKKLSPTMIQSSVCSLTTNNLLLSSLFEDYGWCWFFRGLLRYPAPCLYILGRDEFNHWNANLI